jgi:hypothetical protein
MAGDEVKQFAVAGGCCCELLISDLLFLVFVCCTLARPAGSTVTGLQRFRLPLGQVGEFAHSGLEVGGRGPAQILFDPVG